MPTSLTPRYNSSRTVTSSEEGCAAPMDEPSDASQHVWNKRDCTGSWTTSNASVTPRVEERKIVSQLAHHWPSLCTENADSIATRWSLRLTDPCAGESAKLSMPGDLAAIKRVSRARRRKLKRIELATDNATASATDAPPSDKVPRSVDTLELRIDFPLVSPQNPASLESADRVAKIIRSLRGTFPARTPTILRFTQPGDLYKYAAFKTHSPFSANEGGDLRESGKPTVVILENCTLGEQSFSETDALFAKPEDGEVDLAAYEMQAEYCDWLDDRDVNGITIVKLGTKDLFDQHHPPLMQSGSEGKIRRELAKNALDTLYAITRANKRVFVGGLQDLLSSVPLDARMTEDERSQLSDLDLVLNIRPGTRTYTVRDGDREVKRSNLVFLSESQLQELEDHCVRGGSVEEIDDNGRLKANESHDAGK